ncbi:phosphatase domain-containing protein [Lapillicoccus sp.]|uniref:App1 family protein n=1 Tax=Lapillicoccus sp. TaxID=1909287 RepID=UPI003264C0A2
MARPHAAALAEDAWHRKLERGLRRRGWKNRIIGHVGYGSSRPAAMLNAGLDPAKADNVIRVFGRVVLSRDRQPGDDEPDLTFGGMRSLHARDRGWRAFVTAPAMDVPVSVTVGDRTFHTRADRSGHIDASFRGHDLGPGWHHVTLTAQGAEPAQAEVFVVGPDVTHGLVSDIDDTVISTSLPRMMIAAWNTFVRHEAARRVVPGMAPMYRDLLAGHPGAPIVYVSTGAWNTAPTLTRFLRGHGYPIGPLLLTDWGPTNTGWFRSGQEHKRASLDRLARDFPGIVWTLFGDDGQHDPKIYQDFAEARPEVVDAIAIRQLTPTEQVLSHGIPVSNEELSPRTSRAPKDVPVYYAPDGYGLQRILRAAGKLPEPTSS